MNEMASIDTISPAAHGAHDRVVGARVRALRKEKRVSLQALSARSGLSVGYLSQIERGISSASVRALALITDGLGAGLDAIFQPESERSGPVGAFAFTIAERRGLGFWRDGIEKDLLTPGEGGAINLYLVHLAPGGRSGEVAYTHAGSEAGFVLAGSFSLVVEGEMRVLEAGDAFRFKSDRPHRWHNDGRQPCEILWVLATA